MVPASRLGPDSWNPSFASALEGREQGEADIDDAFERRTQGSPTADENRRTRLAMHDHAVEAMPANVLGSAASRRSRNHGRASSGQFGGTVAGRSRPNSTRSPISARINVVVDGTSPIRGVLRASITRILYGR